MEDKAIRRISNLKDSIGNLPRPDEIVALSTSQHALSLKEMMRPSCELILETRKTIAVCSSTALRALPEYRELVKLLGDQTEAIQKLIGAIAASEVKVAASELQCRSRTRSLMPSGMRRWRSRRKSLPKRRRTAAAHQARFKRAVHGASQRSSSVSSTVNAAPPCGSDGVSCESPPLRVRKSACASASHS